MAKRKRLDPANMGKTSVLETKSAFSGDARAPIAQVAADAAASADQIDRIAKARNAGRMILELSLEVIDAGYLVRDRLVVDPEEMHSLVESTRSRGQQTPVEVVDLGDGRYGLISGWRRLEALKQLAGEGEARPALALLRRPGDAADAYLAMAEENEIRVGLSYYERAAIAAAAVDQSVFETEKGALLHIYSTASRAKQSKIRRFLKIVRSLDGSLAFPATLGERMGLALAKMLEERPHTAKELRASFLRVPPENAGGRGAADRSVAECRTKINTPKADAAQTADLSRGIHVDAHEDGSITLSGPCVTPALKKRLMTWLKSQYRRELSLISRNLFRVRNISFRV